MSCMTEGTYLVLASELANRYPSIYQRQVIQTPTTKSDKHTWALNLNPHGHDMSHGENCLYAPSNPPMRILHNCPILPIESHDKEF